MRALRWHGRRDVRVDDVPEARAPGNGEITVEVLWCGICGTDLEEYEHGPLLIPVEPHPLTGHRAPLILGHEVAGRVAVAGDRCGLEVGTLVALDGYYFCGSCAACLRHQVNLCERWGHIGLSAPGGLAERLTVPAAMALPATGLSSDALALAEPFAVAVGALRRARLVNGERVCVLGAGAIGLAVTQAAVAIGATVVVADPSALRRSLATASGAVDTAEASGAIGQRGFDVVIDCTGIAAATAHGLAALRRGGRLVLVGIAVEPGQADWRRIVLEELEVLGSVGHVYDEDTVAAVSLLSSGQVQPELLITHRIGLDEAVTGGFELLAARTDDVVKVLVAPCS